MIKIILLALVQGLTEFLPISSSGHLALLSRWFSASPQSDIGVPAFDFFLAVFLHGGTLLATVYYFWPDIRKMVVSLRKPETEGRNYLKAVIVGSVPVALFGLLLENRAEKTFGSLTLLPVMFLITSLFLATAGLKKEGRKELRPHNAFGVGLAQLLAILPGISRSGSTISAGLILGISREEAFRFSFLLSLPAVAGAFLIETVKAFKSGVMVADPLLILGFISSFVAGLFALRLLRRLVLSGRLVWFSLYLLLLSVLLLFTGG
ncbi:MAG: undecaprenyl-diphosphate phosphatase [Candidatus Omnitrophota bacterium]